MADYIFTMIPASKFNEPERKVLDDITLAFLPSAKTGVLGPNGAGFSDTEFERFAEQAARVFLAAYA